MSERYDFLSENECQYEFDKNILSLLTQLLSEKLKPTKIENQATSYPESPILTNLSDDGKYVLQCLAVLSNIVVKQSTLTNWLGEHYSDVLSTLVAKGLVTQYNDGTAIEFQLNKEALDTMPKDIQLNLHNNKWIVNLCSCIADVLGKQSEILIREKPLDRTYPDEIQSERWMNLSKLLLDILIKLDFMNPISVRQCIKSLKDAKFDSIECIRFYEVDISYLLEKCISSPCFSEVSAQQRYDAYCLRVTALLNKFNMRSWNSDDGETFDEEIKQIIDSIKSAELIMSELPDKVKEQRAYEICLPILEMVCYDGAESIRIKTHATTATKLYRFVMSYLDRITIDSENEYKILLKKKLFVALIEEALWLETGRLRMRCLRRIVLFRECNYEDLIIEVGKGALVDDERFSEMLDKYLIGSAVENDEEEENSHDGLHHNQEESNEANYDGLDIEEYLENFEASINELILKNPEIDEDKKAAILYRIICDYGFNPELWHYKRREHIDNSEKACAENIEPESKEDSYRVAKREAKDWREFVEKCGVIINQQKAKICMEHLLSLPGEVEPIDDFEERCEIQAIMIYSCLGDEDALKKSIERYFRLVVEKNMRESCCISNYFDTLELIGRPSSARLFARIGIEIFEAEAVKPNIAENTLFLIYYVLIGLAKYIGNDKKIEYYARKQREVLGLGFRYV